MKNSILTREKETILAKIISLLEAKAFITFAYVYGSFLTSESFQDIDIGAYLTGIERSSPLLIETGTSRELEDMLRIPFDVRILNGAPPTFLYHVIKDGVVIIDRDSSARADFEGLILKKYFDFQHLRREYLREIVNAPV